MSEPPEPWGNEENIDQESQDVYNLFLRRVLADQAGAESILFNRPDPTEPWNVEQAQEARRGRQAEQRHELAMLRAQHNLLQVGKDRDLVRKVTYGLAILVACAFLFLAGVMVLSENDGRQKWAQESLVVLFTATVSAVAGWFANRKS